MALIKTVQSKKPKIGSGCFLAETAVIIGDVIMGMDCSVWYQAVIRGDVNTIRIGDRVNIQDGAVVHCTYQKADTLIGDDVSIGHNAIIHGCRIEDSVLIGMGAIVMDEAVIPSRVIVGAGCLVPEKKVLESGWIYVGSPARKLRQLDAQTMSSLIDNTARHYITYASWFSGSSEEGSGPNDF